MTQPYRLEFPAQALTSADPAVAASLQTAKAQTGFIPNMYAYMANSPGLLETYLDGYARFRSASQLTPAEQEVVFLTISRDNGCEYCMAAHSTLADKMSKVPPAVIEAVRSGAAIPDARFAALSRFTATMLATGGRPSTGDVEAFIRAGYGERHVLEIILAISVKTLSNYANHIFQTPLDAMFAGRVWKQAV